MRFYLLQIILNNLYHTGTQLTKAYNSNKTNKILVKYIDFHLCQWINCAELTPRRVLRDKKRASAGPKGQFLSALKDEIWEWRYWRVVMTLRMWRGWWRYWGCEGGDGDMVVVMVVMGVMGIWWWWWGCGDVSVDEVNSIDGIDEDRFSIVSCAMMRSVKYWKIMLNWVRNKRISLRYSVKMYKILWYVEWLCRQKFFLWCINPHNLVSFCSPSNSLSIGM